MGRGGQVMGNGRNTGVTAGQVGVVESEMICTCFLDIHFDEELK